MTRAALGLLGVLLLVTTAQAQRAVEPADVPPPAERPRPFSEDNHALRFILHYMVKVKPNENFEDIDPKDSALIILGDTSWLDNPDYRRGFRSFIRGGGNILIATDQNTAALVRETLGIHVVGGAPVQTRDRKDAYRGEPDCPLIRELNHSYPIFQGVNTIATNRPGRVEGEKNRVELTVPFPESCRPEEAKTVPSFCMIGEPGVIFNVGGRESSSRILVISDHSIFINSMMLRSDKENDNFDFAFNCVRWVCNADDGVPQRKHVFLVHDGTIEDNFEVRVKAVPNGSIPLEALNDLPAHPVDLANALLAKWEDENIHNEILLGNTTWRQILSGAAIALSIALIAYGLYRIQQAHYRVETGP